LNSGLTREEEHAQSTLRAAPPRPNMKDTRPDAALIALPGATSACVDRPCGFRM